MGLNRCWRKVGGILMLLGLLFWGGCADRGARALLEGEQLLQAGKYAEATAKLVDAVDRLPQSALAWNYLGLAYQYAGESAKALEAYEQALRLDRGLSAAHYNLGCLLLETNFVAAAEAFVTYTQLAPREVNGWLKLGTAQLRQAKQLSGNDKTLWLEAAKKNLETSIQLSLTAEAYNALGNIEVQRGRYREAVRMFHAALQKQSDYPPALLNLAIVNQTYFRDRRAALQKYREYLAVQPRSRQHQQIEEMAHRLDGEINPQVITNAAASSNRAAPEVKPEGAAPKTTSYFATVEKNTAPLPEPSPTTMPRYQYLVLSKPVAGHRAAALAFYQQASTAQKAGDGANAASLFRQAVKADPAFYEAHFQLGLIAYQKAEWAACLQSYEQALAIAPDSAGARYNFALALQKAGFISDAVNELAKILAKNPKETRSHLLLAGLCAQHLRQKEVARRHYQKVLELEPQHPEARRIRSWLAQNP